MLRRRRPDPNDDALDRLEAFLRESQGTYERIVATARAQERILAVAPLLVALGDVLAGILALEPELSPEIVAATGQIGELAATFDRMQTFVATRLAVHVERSLGEVDDDRPSV